jgi:hypothetical protein
MDVLGCVGKCGGYAGGPPSWHWISGAEAAPFGTGTESLRQHPAEMSCDRLAVTAEQ